MAVESSAGVDVSYPVIAGISPNEKPDDAARAEHTVLITGYNNKYRGTGEIWVTLRDPYPYGNVQSPYAKAGYSYDAATRRARLPWRVLRDRLEGASTVFAYTATSGVAEAHGWGFDKAIKIV